MNEINKILSRLSVVGNPVFLLKLLNDVSKFVKSHQNSYPVATEFKSLFVKTSDALYQIMDGRSVKFDRMPVQANLIEISEQDLSKLADLLSVKVPTRLAVSDRLARVETEGVENSYGDRGDENFMNDLFVQLRRVKNIKGYKEILSTVDGSFSTNLTMNQLAKVVINQTRG